MDLIGLLGSLMALALQTPIAPPGYTVTPFATGLNHPTALTLGPAGVIYATEQKGRVVSFRAGAKRPVVFAQGLRDSTLGLVFADGKLLVSDKGRVTSFSDSDHNRVADRSEVILKGLPNGRHQQDNLARGPDGRVYLGEGSRCDACKPRPREASILSFRPDGSDVRVVATGLRNPYGLAFDSSGVLYATDNGRDDHGDSVPEELNRITPGGRYGYPSCWGIRKGTGCAGTVAPVAELEPHGSADGVAFGASNVAFVALWGTYYGEKHGRYIARVDTQTGRVTRFASGFDHPLAVLVPPDDSLLVADWGTGIVWRIAKR